MPIPNATVAATMLTEAVEEGRHRGTPLLRA